MGFLLQFIEGVYTGSCFGPSGLRHATHPFQFSAVKAFGFIHLGTFVVFALGFLFNIIGVGTCLVNVGVATTAAVKIEAAVVEFNDVLTYMVEEVTVVCNHQYGQPLFAEKFLQPFNHGNVEMVGGLVEKQ